MNMEENDWDGPYKEGNSMATSVSKFLHMFEYLHFK